MPTSIERERAGQADTSGTMNFLGEMNEFPVFYARQLALNEKLNLEPHEVDIKDYRGSPEVPTLDRHGFALFDHPYNINSEIDADKIMPTYRPVVDELMRKVTGAPKIVHTRPVLRWNGERPASAPFNSNPARFVHTDYNTESFYGFAHKHLEADPDKEHWLAGRIVAFNIWRVLTPPPQDMPLAVMDRRTTNPSQQVNAISYVDEPARPFSFGSTLWRYDEGQRWGYFSDMTPDEALVFVSWDSDSHHRAGTAHSSFDNALCPPGVKPRSSMEHRVFCYWGREA